jgi:hypothetical protein
MNSIMLSLDELQTITRNLPRPKRAYERILVRRFSKPLTLRPSRDLSESKELADDVILEARQFFQGDARHTELCWTFAGEIRL